MNNDKIKSMKLYNFIDRVYNELKELGKEKTGDLSTSELSSFDQLHYHGTEAIDYAIEKCDINEKSKVLEIGSGIGGPSRYIAQKTGANVTALELQNDHHKVGIELSKRCGLDNNVEHICGDFLTYDFKDNRYDTRPFVGLPAWFKGFKLPPQKK